MSIYERVQAILKELPPGVTLVAATKTRSVEEIRQALDAGITVLGENYVQEAEKKQAVLGRTIQWHLIGHLQRNKAGQAVAIFDLIQTLDSWKLAEELDRKARAAGLVLPVLIEVNSGREQQKSGLFPEDVLTFVNRVATLENLSLQGLMTMGPLLEKPESIRPFFRLTREIFEEIKKQGRPGVEMRILSMGMSDTWRLAVEEGANMVRVGTAIFGPRPGQ
ncbi:MAG TPA: YggS family pyridoxal phosphate-dependent enzyme [bacterium]|nr:YggS family pyridoxal phosphate-dependent enzyme [bacterium]HPP12106.1 YggS family pyridoxal phosphate-dependent enzyme [bacterium]